MTETPAETRRIMGAAMTAALPLAPHTLDVLSLVRIVEAAVRAADAARQQTIKPPDTPS